MKNQRAPKFSKESRRLIINFKVNQEEFDFINSYVKKTKLKDKSALIRAAIDEYIQRH